MAQFKSRKFALPKPTQGDGRGLFFNDSAATTVGLAAADTIDFIIPKGFELSRLELYHTQLDSSTGLTAKVGWATTDGAATAVMNGAATATNDALFAATAAFGRSATGVTLLFAPVTFEVDVILRITVVVVATTPVAGTVHAKMGGNDVGVK